jgi:phosphatidylinositol kinase/protein kinase (PI-3  family)
MQQMFGMVSELLKQNHETNKRRLKIRRYKVIPLSQVNYIQLFEN